MNDTINQNLKNWMIRNNKSMTYGDILKLSENDRVNDIYSFYTKDEYDLLQETLKSNRNRLQRFQ